MDTSRPCRKVRQKILSPQEDPQQHAMDPFVTEHLSECEACRSLHSACLKLNSLLAEEKLRVGELSRPTPGKKRELLLHIAEGPPKQPTFRLRAAWAGAAVALLVTVSTAAFYLLRGGGGKDERGFGRPMTTWSRAMAASYKTFGDLAEVTRRHEAPALELPYTPPETSQQVPFPQLLEQCSVQSRNTLGSILQAKTNIIGR